MADLPFGLQEPAIEKPSEVLIGFCECGAIRVVSHGPTSEEDWNAHISHGQVWGRYDLGEWRMLDEAANTTPEDGGTEQ